MANMSVTASPLTELEARERAGAAVRKGLAAYPKHLPPWLFYDESGSRLFDAITELEEYYLTRTEREILARNAEAIVAAAAQGARVRIQELGAGSAEKTRLLLQAAVDRQRSVIYEPIDVSASALDGAREHIERDIPGVHVIPRVMDYTQGPALELDADHRTRRLVAFIGSSIGNFEPEQAGRLLKRIRAGIQRDDSLLLGIDLVKNENILIPAYDDAEGVTAAFNLNVLARLNRDFGANFDLNAFEHRAVWNGMRSRVEMHLESLRPQRVHLPELDMVVEFSEGETVHTENSYKYETAQIEEMLGRAGFAPAALWTDPKGWFAVYLGRAE